MELAFQYQRLASNSAAEQCSNWHSDSPRRRKFVSEQALVEKFISISSYGNEPYQEAVFEVDSGNGIADIILLKVRRDWEKHTGILRLRPEWGYCLSLLPYRREFQVEDLAKLAGTTKRTALAGLLNMEASGYCRKSRNGWIKQRQPIFLTTHTHAIEAKLQNWRKALYQASRYKEFANNSWVLLDEHYSKPAIANICQFERRNIGLITINSLGEWKKVYSPHPAPPRSEYRKWYTMIKSIQQLAQDR